MDNRGMSQHRALLVLEWNGLNRLLGLRVGEGIDTSPERTDTDHRQIYLCYNKKDKVHPCTGTEALYRPYGP